MHSLLIENEDVLRLDVSVDYITFLQVQQCLYHLRNHYLSLIFVKSLLSFKSLKKVAILAVLQYYVNAWFVVEVAVQTDYVWVLESVLNFQFLFQLGEKVKFLESSLDNYFQSNLSLRVFLYGFENFAKFTVAYRLNAAKVICSPLSPGWRWVYGRRSVCTKAWVVNHFWI